MNGIQTVLINIIYKLKCDKNKKVRFLMSLDVSLLNLRCYHGGSRTTRWETLVESTGENADFNGPVESVPRGPWFEYISRDRL
jgi:hypothetical protein